VIYFKNFCKCPNVPTAAIKIINILFFLLMWPLWNPCLFIKHVSLCLNSKVKRNEVWCPVIDPSVSQQIKIVM
jgi:hypothetical protein